MNVRSKLLDAAACHAKSVMFCSGMDGGTLEEIKDITRFKLGRLLVRHFILPKSVIKKINQLCIRFFWKANDIAAACARFNWDQVCCLKSEGGLGIKELEYWNRACILKLIRCILAREESI
ncbi:hypothetical protein J1N35_011700 [Gossypium stocksii]|uniref:Uncharacterized protein n=1 Tax=Gossypium stocksii TaxID=47602 RepID=A0A9D3W382_9ROSI|nr:hypothetical protein J1N35_011700 [Gossypium stocksii]